MMLKQCLFQVDKSILAMFMYILYLNVDAQGLA